MQTFKFDVKGISRGGCTSSVQRALSGLDGVQKVDVTLQPGSATFEGDPDRVTAQKIQSTLAAVGYEALARARTRRGRGYFPEHLKRDARSTRCSMC